MADLPTAPWACSAPSLRPPGVEFVGDMLQEAPGLAVQAHVFSSDLHRAWQSEGYDARRAAEPGRVTDPEDVFPA